MRAGRRHAGDDCAQVQACLTAFHQCAPARSLRGGPAASPLREQGVFGPFEPQVPTEVPLWLAVTLKRRQQCQIQAPDWLEEGARARDAKHVPIAP